MNWIRRKTVLLAFMLSIISFIVILLCAEFAFESWFDRIETKIYDYRYNNKISRAFSRPSATIDDIVIVDIDQRTLDSYGLMGTWKNDRYRKIVELLEGSGSLAIGIDLSIPALIKGDESSDSLLSLISRNNNICVAVPMVESQPHHFLGAMDPLRIEEVLSKHVLTIDSVVVRTVPRAELITGVNYDLYQAGYRSGGVLIQTGHDHIVRSIPLLIRYQDTIIPSFPLAVVITLLHLENEQIRFHPGKTLEIQIDHDDYIRIPVNSAGQMVLNFQGPMQTFKHVSFADVIDGAVDQTIFRDRIVLIGSSSENVFTGLRVPFQRLFSVIELHANIICSIVTEDFITEPNRIVYYLILFLSIFVTIFILITLRKFWGYLISAGMIALIFLISVELLKYADIWLNTTMLIGGILCACLIVSIYQHAHRQEMRHSLFTRFKNHISDGDLRRLVKESSLVTLSGDRRVATALFTNIRDFTKIVENLSPPELIAVLNEYLSSMSEIILRHSGYVDKYEGDTVYAIWGAPLKQDEHAINACDAALEMQRQLVDLQGKWERDELPQLQMQIGIDTGHLILGNVGGPRRFDYTAIGDTVNVAHRLEAANKMYNTRIIISETTFKLIQDMFWVRELDYIRVKGNKKPIKIYELIGRKSEQIDQVRSSGYEYFLQGLAYYRQRDWVKAFNYFYKAVQLIPEDGPSQEFLRRCKIFIEQPRPEDWDGVFNLRSK